MKISADVTSKIFATTSAPARWCRYPYVERQNRNYCPPFEGASSAADIETRATYPGADVGQ